MRALFLLAIRTVQHLTLFCRKVPVNAFILITLIQTRRDIYSSLITWSLYDLTLDAPYLDDIVIL